MRPSINLIACKASLAIGEKKKEKVRLGETAFKQAGGAEGDALNFVLTSCEPLLLRIASEDPIPTTGPPWRFVLVLRLKLRIKFGGGKTLC